MTEFHEAHERLGGMHGYADVTSGPFDPGVSDEMPAVVSGALLAILTRLAESQERTERRLDALEHALKAGAVGNWGNLV